MKYDIDLSLVKKKLAKLPDHILVKLYNWANQIEFLGLHAVRKIPGYHDEPLKGDRKGQRSIRLSRSYRAIYIEDKNGLKILVIEVNKHEY